MHYKSTCDGDGDGAAVWRGFCAVSNRYVATRANVKKLVRRRLPGAIGQIFIDAGLG
jgi:hypothetical protein